VRACVLADAPVQKALSSKKSQNYPADGLFSLFWIICLLFGLARNLNLLSPRELFLFILLKVSTGEVTQLGPTRLYTSFAPSPDARYVMVAWLERPFSYTVPCGRFPKRVQLWDRWLGSSALTFMSHRTTCINSVLPRLRFNLTNHTLDKTLLQPGCPFHLSGLSQRRGF
jgi:hypothetical protein